MKVVEAHASRSLETLRSVSVASAHLTCKDEINIACSGNRKGEVDSRVGRRLRACGSGCVSLHHALKARVTLGVISRHIEDGVIRQAIRGLLRLYCILNSLVIAL